MSIPALQWGVDGYTTAGRGAVLQGDRMNGPVAVVTGGARGIDYATAVLLSSRGAQVVVADAQPMSKEAKPFDEILTDVTDAGQVARLFASVSERYGRLDILVVNAGRPYTSTSLNSNESEWNECLNLYLKSARLCAREAHALLRGAGVAASWWLRRYRASMVVRRRFLFGRKGRATGTDSQPRDRICAGHSRQRGDSCTNRVGSNGAVFCVLSRSGGSAAARYCFLSAWPNWQTGGRRVRDRISIVRRSGLDNGHVSAR